MALSKTTQDHDEIRKWAEARGAQPAEVKSTHRKNEPGILRFCFPKAVNRNDENLKEISWDEFFEKFDDSNLELVYQEKTASGEKSNFNKLVYPDSEGNSGSKHGGSKGENHSGSKRASAKSSGSKSASARSSGTRSRSAKSTGARSASAKSSGSKRPSAKSSGGKRASAR